MSFYRSKEMEFYNLVIPRESAWKVVNSLGFLDMIHFVDHDPGQPQINRPFSNYIKRCEEVLQKIKNIQDEMRLRKIPIKICPDIKELLQSYGNINHQYFEELEHSILQSANDLSQQQKSLKVSQDKLNLIIENIEVLKQANTLQQEERDFEESQLIPMKFLQIVGVILKEDELRFKRIIFRVTKGSCLINTVDIEHKFPTGQKVVFNIILREGVFVNEKINKIIDSFQATKFELPKGAVAYEQREQILKQELIETQNLIEMTITQINLQLQGFANVNKNCSQIEEIRIYVEKERYLYQTLNMLKMTSAVFSGQLWIPKVYFKFVEQTMRQLSNIDEQIPVGQLQQANTKEHPPTYFKLNDFTAPFQEIVNTYGVPRYREINPGLSTLITFPFLFGVMFADIGHGFLLFAFGIFLCSQDLSNSSFKPFYQVRFMFLLMGFFAFYNGFIYNDYLSLTLNLFGSCYTVKDNEFERAEDCNYPFGLDPAWGVSANHIAFTNSYKMKLAVIIGVIHMIFGIILKGFNAIHSSNTLDFVFEFIPQFLFLLCTFGYMDVLIVMKWLTNFEDTSLAPSIITTMIDMILNPFATPEQPLFTNAEDQLKTSQILLLIALICVPTMLIFKPLIINSANKKKQENQFHILEQKQSEENFEDIRSPSANVQEEHQHEEFGDLVVHQVIETIEFVLGSVSNTASYLRLWALSLAHSQLAEVFYHMTISDGIADGGLLGAFGAIAFYPMFACSTFGVLMCMDLMECFLHALRLQWVEFQNKFYKADGYLFVPFSYSKIQSIDAGFDQDDTKSSIE